MTHPDWTPRALICALALLAGCAATAPSPAPHGGQARGEMACMNKPGATPAAASTAGNGADTSAHAGHGTGTTGAAGAAGTTAVAAAAAPAAAPAAAASGGAAHCAMMKTR